MRAVANTLRVLEELAATGPAGVSELARATAIPKSTVQRCLLAAADAGWIEAAGADPTRWVVAARVVTALGRGVRPDLHDVARPVMVELARRTGDAVHLVGRDGADAVLLERIAGDHLVQVVVPVGSRVPVHAGATGKALLAAMPAADVDALLPARLDRLTPSTITTRTQLHRALDRIRLDGYATNDGEWDRTVAAVAAAVVDRGGRPLAALSVSTTPGRLGPARVRELGPLVADAAERIGARLR